MNKEDAKAIQEVSKTTSRALDSVDGLGRFVEDAFGYPIREASGFLGDWIKFKRENWKTTAEMSKGILDVRGVKDIGSIQAKYAVDIMQKSSLEDDALLQKMWAGLIANSLDSEVDVVPCKILILLLAEMDSLDALLLMKVSELGYSEFKASEVTSLMDLSLAELLLPIENLCRIGLLRHNIAAAYGGEIKITEGSQFALSALSETLLTSVRSELIK